MKIVLTLLAASTLLVSDGACADANAEPTIYAQAPSTLSYKHTAGDHDLHIHLTYGDNLTIFCTAGDLADLTLNGLLKRASEYNSTTIQVTIEKLDVGEHIYQCEDINTGYNQSLIVTVHPAVAVASPNVRQTSGKYYVPRDEIYDVFCIAHDVKALSLEAYSNELFYYSKLHTKAVNATTVSATVTNNLEVRRYKCQKAEIYTVFDVIVDYSPEVQDFQCVLHLSRMLECKWTSSNTKNTFKLSSEGKLLCTDMSGVPASGCAHGWDTFLDDAYAFSPIITHLNLQLEVCNNHCKNQTFSIEIRSIIKLEPVRNLQVKFTKPKSEVMLKNNIYAIEWLHRSLLCYRGCEYKMQYRLVGMHWRQVQVSDVAGYEFSGGVMNTFKLALPCPKTLYEVRLYVRPKTVKNERLWSEPASLEYATLPRDIGPDDLSCAEFRRQEPISTADAAL